MSKNKKLIPELRFPEFVNEGEWVENKIDNLFDLQDGYPFSSFDFTKEKSDPQQVIRITDINNQNRKSTTLPKLAKNYKFRLKTDK